MNVAGYRGAYLLRRELGEEVEFITILGFDSVDSVRAFVGEDYEVAHVPAKVAKCCCASTPEPSTTRPS